MRIKLVAAAMAVVLVLPGAAFAKPIPCSELPKAENFVRTKLRPGPNTRAAERSLAEAHMARTPAECSAALARVDYYARRSAAADKRAAESH